MTGATLLCLPFAGAHVDPCFPLRKLCERRVPGLTTLSHTYPGHGRRLGDRLIPTIGGMADDCVDRLGDLGGDGPLLLLGYSMGAYVAYEVAMRLAAMGRRVPLVMFMAATPPHRLAGADLNVTTDEDLLDHCLQYGLVQQNSFQTSELKALFLPALRNDILAVDRYAAASGGLPARPLPNDTMVGVFQALEDRTVSDPKDWDEIAATPPTHFRYVGGHFFINECADELQRDVLELLGVWLERS